MWGPKKGFHFAGGLPEPKIRKMHERGIKTPSKCYLEGSILDERGIKKWAYKGLREPSGTRNSDYFAIGKMPSKHRWGIGIKIIEKNTCVFQ